MFCRSVVLVCALVVLAGTVVSGDAKPKKRMAELDELLGSGGLLEISTMKDYERFVHKGPRSYHVVLVALPLNNPQAADLRELKESSAQVAGWYNQHLTTQRNTAPATKRAIVFVFVDTSALPAALMSHGLQGRGAVLVIPPVTERTSAPLPLQQDWVFDFRMPWTPEYFHAWVVARTGVQFEEYVNPLVKIGMYAAVGATAIVVLLTLRFVIPRLVGPTHRMFWYFVCVVVFIGCFGGTHHCILRDSQFYMIHPRTHKVMLFHPSGNAQFYAEGYIASGLEVLTGLLLVALGQWYPKMSHGIMKRLVGYTLVCAFFGAAYALRFVYLAKKGWL